MISTCDLVFKPCAFFEMICDLVTELESLLSNRVKGHNYDIIA